MSKVIGRNDVQRLGAERAAQIVEVLPHAEFESAHIAGAINIPLPELNAASVRRLDPAQPVVVYCNDFT